MNNRDRTMAAFHHRKADRLVWQPRLNHWYDVNKARGLLPKKYAGWEMLQIYDDLGASPRAWHYFNDTVRAVEGGSTKIEVKEDSEFIRTKYTTPKGEVTQTEQRNLWGTNKMTVDYFLKTIDDFDALAYVLRNQSFEFDADLYQRYDRMLGDRCEPTLNIPHGSIQRLFVDYMGLERGTIALWRHPELVEKLILAFDENDDKRIELIKRTPFRLVNFADNIDDSLVSPRLLRKYMLPYYQRRTKELHQVGKFCTSHWDGKIKHVLPFARETGLDALEAVPPVPQGSVTLEELRQGLEGMVLLDGLPATRFVPYSDEAELKKAVKRLLELFSPNIVVGISDMLPADGDIERVRTTGKMVEEYSV